MDFTREPIIETVITSKDGFRLLIRSIAPSSQEEHSVVAVEVVSFGQCYFFRSLEKPQAFLLPMAQYEIVEEREVRAVLKKASPEKSIKIGVAKKVEASKEEPPLEEGKKREKKRLRKKHVKEDPEKSVKKEGISSKESKEENYSPPKLSLLPPPTSLISDQINRYKSYLLQKEEVIPSEKEDRFEEQEEKRAIGNEKHGFFDEESSLGEKSGKDVDQKAPTSSEEAP